MSLFFSKKEKGEIYSWAQLAEGTAFAAGNSG
jgi:hypothetical protein